MSRVRLLATLIALTAILPATAQTSKALISGIVTDGTGAAIGNPCHGIRVKAVDCAPVVRHAKR